MTVRGFFDPDDLTRKPLVDAVLWLPRFDRVRELTFVVDTGADMSMLSFADGVGLLPAATDPDRIVEGRGIGGRASFGVEAAVIALLDEGHGLRETTTSLYVATEDIGASPFSVLGRDVLQHFELRMNISADLVPLDHVEAGGRGAVRA